ncbi:ABC-ATPase domain-containing protein [Actinobaculum suis]|uniref:ABC-ATPase domain-containing protein n=1 Tax=Actinobaculum suis TaxID=1657 RepID=UPI0008087FB4|nr:ABC-ATPase domain-containing protein [Actinobaculum suis]OCA93761.1 ATPase [Actinobaculum suis]OCA94054.1 ATPase [Actinobaculum suis]
MPRAHDLADTLRLIDGKPYGAYRDAVGRYDVGGGVTICLDKAQRDPFAPPSPVRICLTPEVAQIPAELISDRRGRVATADFLTRSFWEGIRRAGFDRPSGTGSSGKVEIDRPGQEVLERASLVITPAGAMEARLYVGLPASGRRVRGREAARLLAEDLPDLAEDFLRYDRIDGAALRHAVTLYRDQEAVRDQLASRQLVAFVGDGAILPRWSGASDLPLPADAGAIAFASPESLRVSFELPSGGTVTGMGIPEGITLIVGGGYHGKSTLLRALERGVYAHVAGDGREWVITRADAAAIRAEDGRATTGTDISMFINNLPSGADTKHFSTPNASGSTSQAANLAEAVEAGASALLIDEDTSATNFMIRDERMRELIPDNREPITPFVARVRELYARSGVSTVLVAGGSGAFFDVADVVIAMDAYRPTDVTARAHEISGSSPTTLRPDTDGGLSVSGSAGNEVPMRDSHPRKLGRHSLPYATGGKPRPPRARGLDAIQMGKITIDLSALTQLVDSSQTEAIARAITLIADKADGELTIREAAEKVDELIAERGLDALANHRGHPGNLARPRVLEITAAINRFRGLKLA